ncbi:ribonuclease R [Microbulbifer sp. 2205BS26-8]|uniref:ribonuclease R n=1 Tax=Microbulbifer sp. 2205BS26-8 TaxID=3064386 RepID=UPI00273DF6D8|nr:ribonuclease R [Microbulbifer sp. 2205BS26-8]MDP5210241.1 ribonuclease R [Microbulbifer sp. 2205BS26-8]
MTHRNTPDPFSTDPHAQREAEKYEKPVPSREFLLQLLEQQAGPVSWEDVAELLGLQDEDRREGVRRRLIAMSRDGQIASNRAGDFGVLDKMSLIRGRVIGHRDGFGFVIPGDGGEDLFLSHRQMRRVFDGDEVLVRETPGGFRGKREGAVLRVIKHNTEQLAGRLFRENGICFVRPDNPRINLDIMVAAEDSAGAGHGQYVVVRIVTQPGRDRVPQGEVVEVLGDHLAPGMEIEVAIRNYGVPHSWPSALEAEAAAISEEVLAEDKRARVDLRQLPLVTIDGEDARDFDDAVFCELLPDGTWKLLVAIADVSHYVRLGSALDEEAHKRGNSVYFPDFVVPMLPEKLSNGLCSLNPEVDRLCMVCEMQIDGAGDILDYRFFEGVMRSHARLTYTQVGELLAARDDKRNNGLRKQFATLTPHLDRLHDLYLALRGARDRRGAIDFETTETRIVFDSNRKIERIVPVVRNDAHKLIEECMLAANVCAADLMALSGLPSLYRVHDVPKEEKLSNLREYLGELGLRLPGGAEPQPRDFQALLAQVEGRADAHIIQMMMLRSMNQAVYQPENRGHFGLDYRAYAHFTSPIRRYPDLLLHRALRWLIHNGKANQRAVAQKVHAEPGAGPIDRGDILPYDLPAMVQLGEQCSMTERRADDATRDVVSWLKCEYLQDHVGDVYSGVVSAVTGFGLFVELDDLYVEGLIHVTALPRDYYRFEQAHQRLIGERSGKRYHLGDSVTVQVARVDLEERKVDFILQQLVSRTRKNRAEGGTSGAGVTKVSARAMEMAVDHQRDRERRGKQKKSTQRTTGDSPWSGSAKTAEQVPPFRKRKVGSSEAVPVEASGEQPARKKAAGEAPAEKPGEDTAPKRRSARRTPPRKGGKRPAVAARKAAQKTGKGKAGTVKAKKRKTTSSSKKKK